MGCQVQRWSRSLAIATHGLRVVAVPDGEILIWTREGCDPLPIALASTISGMVGVTRMGTVIPSSTVSKQSPVRRDAANVIGWLRRNTERVRLVRNGL
ncbi:hypothetical protein A4X13_0g5042 [Tilletia indica]|uniref:Uncharacterized protein n=1 Tax=Tilletia indica TaxID=43049 RepID=A0A8T8SVY9_9BASI|nr:hypothetical protein A4X13_0g5042 [Tilletia indica]